MEEMGKEKTRPQVIAISARRTIGEHPECKRYLQRKQERIPLDDRHWIIWSSKSFRLHRSKPCSIRVFFSKRKPPSSQWKKTLKAIIQDRLGVAISLKNVVVPEKDDNFIEISIENPRFILSLLNHRVAGFLD